MRIHNKYLRNKHFRIKNWKRVRVKEHPYETFMPFLSGTFIPRWTHEEQVESSFKYIEKRARCLETGGIYSMDSAPASFRRQLNKTAKAKVRHAMARINMGDWDYEVPIFKKDAAWLYW